MTSGTIEFFMPTPNERWTDAALDDWIGKPLTFEGREYGCVLEVHQTEGGLIVRCELEFAPEPTR